MISVKHNSVSTLRDDPLLRVLEGIVEVVRGVNQHFLLLTIDAFVKASQLVELLLFVKVADREVVLEMGNESLVLFDESFPVSEVTST